VTVVEPEEINAGGIVAALRFAIQEGSTSGAGDAVVVSMAEGSAGGVRSPWLVVLQKSIFGGVRSHEQGAGRYLGEQLTRSQRYTRSRHEARLRWPARGNRSQALPEETLLSMVRR